MIRIMSSTLTLFLCEAFKESAVTPGGKPVKACALYARQTKQSSEIIGVVCRALEAVLASA